VDLSDVLDIVEHLTVSSIRNRVDADRDGKFGDVHALLESLPAYGREPGGQLEVPGETAVPERVVSYRREGAGEFHGLQLLYAIEHPVAYVDDALLEGDLIQDVPAVVRGKVVLL
jgi:hypothetical protein